MVGSEIIWLDTADSKGEVGVCREIALLGREKPLPNPAMSLKVKEKRLVLQVSPQPLLPTHPLPIAKTAQPGLGLFPSCSDKSQLLSVLLRMFEVALEK